MSLHALESLDGVKSRITAFYQRVTAEESFKRNLSIPAQRAEAEELARRHGWAPFTHYTEPKKVRASVWQRPAFLELVRDIEAGKILRVVARHEDRFWRDLEVQQRFIEILRRHQVGALGLPRPARLQDRARQARPPDHGSHRRIREEHRSSTSTQSCMTSGSARRQ